MLLYVLLIMIGILLIVSAVFYILIMQTRKKNKKLGEIITQEGIQEECYVNLGGVPQFLQIRGENKTNSVVLFLHGGPGSPTSYYSFYYQHKLEEKFTIVQWEQRGSGRSYFQRPADEMPSTKQILSDVDQLVDYLRTRFSCEKVLLMGHSCGTLFGCQYILKHPEKISGYIGISQCVNVWESNLSMGRKVFEEANGNQKTAEKLRQALERLENVKNWDAIHMKDYLTVKILIQQMVHYPGELTGAKSAWLGITSPYFSKLDWEWYKISMSLEKLMGIEERLMRECLYELDLEKLDRNYKVPILFINGSCDTIAPAQDAKRFLDSLEAPSKEIYVMEHAGHMLFMEKKDEFCDKILEWTKQIRIR